MKQRIIKRTELFEQQLDEQLEWYVRNVDDHRIPGRFLDTVENAVTEIANTPELFSPLVPAKGYEDLLSFGLRFKKIDRHFPFFIYYQFNEESVTLRFIWHGGRNRDDLLLNEMQ